MVEGLFFDRIDRKSCGRPVAERIKLPVDVPPYVAKPGLSIADPAKARTQRTKDSAVGFGLPPNGLFHEKNIPRLALRSKSRAASALYRPYAIVGL